MDDVGRSNGEHSRERQLWCAVVYRAVQDATQAYRGPGGPTLAQLRERDEARSWFADNSEEYCYACESAGLDPDFVREHVLRFADRVDLSTPYVSAAA